MRIKHYPGKAVVSDPSWLEMDIPNSTRGMLYEANWLDTQRNLSSGSSTNSWDRYSGSSLDTAPYRRLQELERASFEENDESTLYTLPKKDNKTGSLRLRYHSDKCLSRINSKNNKDLVPSSAPTPADYYQVDDYYLPSQNRIKRDQSFKSSNTTHEDVVYDVPFDSKKDEIYNYVTTETPKPKPRTKLPSGANENYKTVISDLEKQIKKSVRFNDKSTEISLGAFHGDEAAIEANEAEEEEEEEATQERVSEWIDDQNKYILNIGDVESKNTLPINSEYSTPKLEEEEEQDPSLNRNDSGYYEPRKKVRQRLPPKNIYPSSESDDCASSIDAGNNSVHSRLSSSSSDCCDSRERDIYDLYKRDRKRQQAGGIVAGDSNCDFIIPRPKLIVPVHSYGIRKRRTGNLLQGKLSCSESGYQHIRENNNGELIFTVRFVFATRHVVRSNTYAIYV